MKKRNKTILGSSILLVTAILWGTTFVAQRMGSDYVSPFTYNFYRGLISACVLYVIYIIKRLTTKRKEEETEENLQPKKSKKYLIIMMILVGIGLFMGQSLQQIGITLTHSAAKAGFISSTYLIFVPIIEIFFHKKVKGYIWICLILALVGSFLIAAKEEFKIELGDVVVLLSAVGFALQIIFVSKVVGEVDAVLVSAIQFTVAFILSFICKVIFEGFDYESVKQGFFAILYAAIFSGCIAFTLQIVGQKYTPPTIASVIMSSECVFSLIFSMIVLHEKLSLLEWIGSGVIVLAIILAQLDLKRKEDIQKESIE